MLAIHSRTFFTLSASFFWLASLSHATPPEFAADTLRYREQIAPILKEHCMKCHGPEKQKSDFRVDTLDPDLISGHDGDHWEEVLNQIHGGDMPPEDEKQLSPAQLGLVSEWLTKELERGAQARSSTGGRGVLRRLTRYEYNHSLQDLLGVDLDHAKQMPVDRAGEDGLQNNGSLLGITATQLAMYLEASRLALDKALLSAQKPEVFSYHAEVEKKELQALGATSNWGVSTNGVEYGDDHVDLARSSHYVLGLKEYPLEGRYRVRARVSGKPDASGRFPTLQVWLGYWADATQQPKVKLGEMVIDEPRVVEFEGYMEDVPLSPSVRTPTDGESQVTEGASAAAQRNRARQELAIWIGNEEPTRNTAVFGQISNLLKRELSVLTALVEVAETPVAAGAKAKARHHNALKAAVATATRDFKGVTVDNLMLDKAKQRIVAITAEKEKLAARYQAARKTQSHLQVDWVEYEGPYFENWPPRTRVDLVGRENDFANDEARARAVLEKFASRAWRRPVTPAEVGKLVENFTALDQHGSNFDAAIRDVFARVLSSPNFLYLVEPTEDDVGARSLNAHELASRLSYFLWSSLPDDELRGLADSGDLLKDEVIAGQVERMLADPKARRLATHFAEQWLGVAQIDGVDVNPEFFPRFNQATKEAMRREPIEFFWHVLSTGKNALDFLSCDYVVVNDRLAAHYGKGAVRGSEFRAVPVREGEHRGGLVTMAGFMLANSDGAVSHPILRGKWVLNYLLNDPPPPPPPGVPELPLADPDFAKLSPAKQLAFHREKEACAQCHDKLDPWGLALENYDAIGQWRDLAANRETAKAGKTALVVPVSLGAPVTLPKGEVVNSTDELRKHLREHEADAFAEGLTRKLMAYALGRSLEWTDKAAVDQITAQFAKSDYRLHGLITAIVTSQTFRNR